MATDGPKQKQPPADVIAEIQSVIARAKSGDATALPLLREVLDRHPDLVSHFGDLARQAESAWITLAAGKNLYLKETAARAAAAQRAELTRPGASPIERLLVDRVVTCGIQLNYFSATEANSLDAGTSHKQLQFHAKRLGQAQRMYLAAVGALTAYQKLNPVPEPQAALIEHATTCADARAPACLHGVVRPQPGVGLAVELEPEIEETEPAHAERLRVGIG